jgi:DivIVA domain-containing protein
LALDRQSIEKKDFPIGRRGYDPDAVDQHLAALADQVEELKLASRRRSETLAGAASEQVRAIVEAAETSAAEIERRAEEEAREIREEAAGEAKATREQATAQARDYVSRVSESTAVMLQRLDAMESELSALIESLRTGGNRLNADLQLLEGSLDEARTTVSPRPRFEPEPEPPTEPPAPPRAPAAFAREPEPEPSWRQEEPAAAMTSTAAEETYAGAAAAEEQFEPEPADAGESGAAEDDDSEGARLIALNMALNGSPREETARYLAENFRLADQERLLDEVYASVEG